MTKNLLENHGTLLAEVKARVRSAQYAALKAVGYSGNLSFNYV